MSTDGRNLFSHLVAAAASDVGRKRKNNEDSFGTFPEFGVWCVADGMGGGDDGEVASAAVVKSVDAFLADLPTVDGSSYAGSFISNGIVAAIEEASGWIYRRTKKNGLKGCGSTFVGVVFDATEPKSATALHVGDSRLYRLRGRELKQITKDHSVAEMMGAKDESQLNPMFRGMILRAVGIEATAEVELTPFSVEEGDAILICSDGLSRMVPDKRIAEVIQSGGDVGDTVRRLIAEANDAGGVDNVTVELIRVGAMPQPVRSARPQKGNESSASSTVRTLDRVYGKGTGKVARGVWIALSAAAAVAVAAWLAHRALVCVREARVPEPPEGVPAVLSEAASAGASDGRVSVPGGRTPAPTNAVPTEAVPTNAVPTNAVPTNAAPTNAVPEGVASAEDVRADGTAANAVVQTAVVAEERERDAVADELKAMRERRRRDEASAAKSEEERRLAARDLARTYDREFTDFACLANRVLGRGSCERAYRFGRKLHSRAGDVDASVCAADFAGALQELAAAIAARLGPKAEGRSGDAVDGLLSQCRALDGADPASPETQRRCLELMRFVATRRMGTNGGR